MQGLQDVSNELMNHYSWMLNYLAGLKKDRPAFLSPVLLLVNDDSQRIIEAPGASIADDWFDQCLRENDPRYAVYVKEQLFTGDTLPVTGDVLLSVLYDKNFLQRVIIAQPYTCPPFQHAGRPVMLGLLSNELLYTQPPALSRPERPPGKRLWKFR
ncbi:hypothetical protein SAMN04488128_106439 [Chitinophaga eiseniae]|uniref:Uncharacterized protein n=1 Tax=Chitinophaga eiseniae TaxID=634771 RepID=A0A1T4TVU2_9BACT|nr:hypothetical protein [Chitinophaga eiseniae]SKA44560.1 hypothetical protein SAMN04488128_106439 [Chitinophaga eiseniae]